MAEFLLFRRNSILAAGITLSLLPWAAWAGAETPSPTIKKENAAPAISASDENAASVKAEMAKDPQIKASSPAAVTPAPAKDKAVLAKGTPQAKSKHNTKLPIEITADSLSVDQQANSAVFSGKVEAIQGEMHLRADKMTVFYTANSSSNAHKKPQSGMHDAGKSPSPAITPAPNTSASASGISKILVNGHVFITSPTETAQGDNGEYNVASSIIHLNGAVVLTQGENIVKGDKLVYNLATGKSIVSTNGASNSAAPEITHQKNGRVRGIFVPKKEQ